jgi:hypothetical protein
LTGGRTNLQAVGRANGQVVVLGGPVISAVAADSGTAETREAAMAESKEQWTRRRGWEHPWIRRP